MCKNLGFLFFFFSSYDLKCWSKFLIKEEKLVCSNKLFAAESNVHCIWICVAFFILNSKS